MHISDNNDTEQCMLVTIKTTITQNGVHNNDHVSKFSSTCSYSLTGSFRFSYLTKSVLCCITVIIVMFSNETNKFTLIIIECKQRDIIFFLITGCKIYWEKMEVSH